MCHGWETNAADNQGGGVMDDQRTDTLVKPDMKAVLSRTHLTTDNGIGLTDENYQSLRTPALSVTGIMSRFLSKHSVMTH